MSHIIELRAENFKKLVAIEIRPNGSLVTVSGMNGAGKTSTLDAIAAALGGKDLLPAEPLRRGAGKGFAEVTLDDGLVIKRTFTPGGGGSLSVASKDGAKYGSPQKLLDGLVGKLSFDPLSFSRMDPKAQAATLRDLVGVDTTELDARRKGAFDERTDVGREVKRLEGALAKLPALAADAPVDEVSVDELTAELERRRATNDTRRAEVAHLEQLRKDAVALKRRIDDLETQLSQARASLDVLRGQGTAQAAKIAALVEADEGEVIERLRTAQATNAAARAAAERRRLEGGLETQRARVDDLTAAIVKVDDEKRALLESAKMPIAGLGFDDACVTLNGLPLAQASSAEQLRASVAIGLAMHPKLKVLLVRDGSLLDEKSLAMVAEMATAADAQVWVERVGKGAECAVIIEDGHVLSAPAPVAESRPNGRKPQARAVRGPGEEG